MKTAPAPSMKLSHTSFAPQKKLALALLDWHGGQSSGLYAVGSCMLSDAERGRLYDPANHRGHADSEETQGALSRAILELRNLRKSSNFPDSVTPKMERECQRLADKLAAHFLTVI